MYYLPTVSPPVFNSNLITDMDEFDDKSRLITINDLVRQISERSNYTPEQALRGVIGIYSLYQDDKAVITAVREFLFCATR
jgi:protocatechuate 3,4-dioxygenase beta subunit